MVLNISFRTIILSFTFLIVMIFLSSCHTPCNECWNPKILRGEGKKALDGNQFLLVTGAGREFKVTLWGTRIPAGLSQEERDRSIKYLARMLNRSMTVEVIEEVNDQEVLGIVYVHMVSKLSDGSTKRFKSDLNGNLITNGRATVSERMETETKSGNKQKILGLWREVLSLAQEVAKEDGFGIWSK